MKHLTVLVMILSMLFFSEFAEAQKKKKPTKTPDKGTEKVIEKPAEKPVEKAAEKMTERTPDYEPLSQKLVAQCANVKEGQSVLISGGVRDLALLENIAVHVRKLGAFPMISLTSDRLVRRMFDDVPAKFDEQVDEFGKKVLKATDVMISIDASENEGLLADIPASRIAARSKAGKEITDVMVSKGIIGVNLGNGLYPTAGRAKQYGISQQQLAKIFWAGVNTDYDKLQAVGDKVKQLLAAADTVRITTPSGTDITLNVYGRTPHVSDGVISEEDVSEGFASSNAYLPAGEIFVTPIQGTAWGKVVVDKLFFQGKEIKGLTLEFKEGRVTAMTAASGLEPLKALYDAAEEGKDEFSFIDIGINPDVSIPQGSSMIAWMPAGMVTVGIGENRWAGGENEASFSLPLFLVNCTVTLDGKTIVENGKLKL